MHRSETDKMMDMLVYGGHLSSFREPFFKLVADGTVPQKFRDQMKEVTAEKLNKIRPEIFFGEECNKVTRKSAYSMRKG